MRSFTLLWYLNMFATTGKWNLIASCWVEGVQCSLHAECVTTYSSLFQQTTQMSRLDDRGFCINCGLNGGSHPRILQITESWLSYDFDTVVIGFLLDCLPSHPMRAKSCQNNVQAHAFTQKQTNKHRWKPDFWSPFLLKFLKDKYSFQRNYILKAKTKTSRLMVSAFHRIHWLNISMF